MKRSDVIGVLGLVCLSLCSTDGSACTRSAPPKGAEAKREVAREFSKATYVVLAEVVVPYDFKKGPGVKLSATWSIRRVWKGLVSERSTLITHTFLDSCPDDDGMKRGNQKIFYLSKLDFDHDNPYSGGSNVSVRNQISLLNALVKGR